MWGGQHRVQRTGLGVPGTGRDKAKSLHITENWEQELSRALGDSWALVLALPPPTLSAAASHPAEPAPPGGAGGGDTQRCFTPEAAVWGADAAHSIQRERETRTLWQQLTFVPKSCR
ncbi:unnamed protein product [Eretmochelys imbricata]